MQIERMTKGEWGKIRAYFDIRTSDNLIVKGFKIVQGSNGPFVGMPSQKNKEGEYKDTVFAEAPIKEELTRIAMEAYGGDITQQQSYQAPPPANDFQGPPPFTDDDIPF